MSQRDDKRTPHIVHIYYVRSKPIGNVEALVDLYPPNGVIESPSPPTIVAFQACFWFSYLWGVSRVAVINIAVARLIEFGIGYRTKTQYHYIGHDSGPVTDLD